MASGVILRQKRAHGSPDYLRFVTGRDDDRDIRPVVILYGTAIARRPPKPLVGAPEPTPEKNQIKPYGH